MNDNNLKRRRIYEDDSDSIILKKSRYYCIYEEYKKYKRQVTMYT